MIIHKLMTPFLDKNLVEQLRIFGTNKEEWKAALLSEIDADQIPAYFGGSMTGPDGDPTCSHRVCTKPKLCFNFISCHIDIS